VQGRQPAWNKGKESFCNLDSFCCHLAGVTGIVPLTGEWRFKMEMHDDECREVGDEQVDY
jgi:hypothetical protein